MLVGWYININIIFTWKKKQQQREQINNIVWKLTKLKRYVYFIEEKKRWEQIMVIFFHLVKLHLQHWCSKLTQYNIFNKTKYLKTDLINVLYATEANQDVLCVI